VAATDYQEFAKRAKSVLWRQDQGKDKPHWDRWKARIEFLNSPAGGGFTKPQAIIRASKEFPCLQRLFREYDVSSYDPTPDSHPQLVMKKDIEPTGTLADVLCENIKQSYRESLQWAIEAAGQYQRTGKKPLSCPCDTAYYLYQQAITEPKDFLGRVGQIESKGVGESAEDKDARRAGKRSIKEIELMLEGMLSDDGE